MRLESAGKSDIGKKRETNQDSFGIYQKDDIGLFVVADGMGGHMNGEKASQIVVAELSNWWKSFSPVSYEKDFRRMLVSIEQVIGQANKKIYTRFNQNGICGTTVVALFIYKNLYGIIYAGDSRCYLSYDKKKSLWQGGKWKQLTVDEVWENQSNISNKERGMKNHPNRGKLVNAVGIRQDIQCRVITDEISPGIVFLLCSDGLYKFCPNKVLGKYMRKCKDKKEIEQAIDKLIDKVYENGAEDNLSIVMVKCLGK